MRLPVMTVLCTTLIATAVPVRADVLTPDELVAELAKGGLVIYFRHAQTEADYADQVTADPGLCASQRVLSEAGWQQARAIGSAVAALDIPVSEVLSSEYCRAWQTADLAFGSYAKTPALNFEPAESYTDAQTAAMRDRVLPLMLAPVTPGTNRVIVGHDDPFEAVTGIYPEPQGVAFVLRADGRAISVLGSIAPDAWPAR